MDVNPLPESDESTGWTADDLESAYLRALEAVEFAEQAVGETLGDDEPAAAEAEIATPVEEPAAVIAESPAEPAAVDPSPAPPPPADAPAIEPVVVEDSAADPLPTVPRILEACLFVGGQPLSAKRLVNLLEGNGEPSQIDKWLAELNQEFLAQNRPYEFRLGDGGYRLVLRNEFEQIRQRVYGSGPREVKLAQDALEVLALVAYLQPISHADVEASGKTNAANLLRQLLRRELIALNRTGSGRNAVEYHTTPRFLQLFGLASLNDLPQADELSLR